MKNHLFSVDPVSHDFMLFAAFISRCDTEFRYLLDEASFNLLERIVEIAESCQFQLHPTETLYRTQLGCNYERHLGAFLLGESPFDEERMLPRADRANEGRLNPKGIPYLYLADNEQTAVAEARPSFDQRITVGRFRTVETLRIASFCCRGVRSPRGSPPTQSLAELTASLFAKPVQRSDDEPQYAATQIIAEALRRAGFDGVYYPSAVSVGGNYALFSSRKGRMILPPHKRTRPMRYVPVVRRLGPAVVDDV